MPNYSRSLLVHGRGARGQSTRGAVTDANDNRLLTTCATCAAPLAYDHKKRCSRCKTRYCSEICQQTHWERGGHDALCKKIKKGGGAEQYHADQKYKEAVAEAVDACAEDTKGQTCYICAEAVHRSTKEGLVRGCACHTTEGYVHVSCLVEQAKTLVAEAEENNLGVDVFGWRGWDTCRLCGQRHHGAVVCALGWGAWKTYLSRPESDRSRERAALNLGNALLAVHRNDEALVVLEGAEATARRLGNNGRVFEVQPSCAQCYDELGMHELALEFRRDHYQKYAFALKVRYRREGEIDIATYPTADSGGNVLLGIAAKLATSLLRTDRPSEAQRFTRRQIPVAQSVLGEDHEITLYLRQSYANSLICRDVTLGDAFEAWRIYEEIVPKAQRIFGDEHPTTISLKAGLENVAVGTSKYIRHAEQTQLAARKIILRFLRSCGRRRAP